MKKGFTLIEILVVTVIAGIVGLGSIFAVANAQRIVNEYTKQAFIASNIYLLMNRIADDIKGGAMLESTSNSLTVKYIDLSEIKWEIKNGKVTRAGADINLPIGSSYSVAGIFSNESASKYHSATVDISLTITDGTETTRENIRNTYYCRIDPDNYVLPSP
ncbi:MAG TPA: type II secretion system protein [Clostridiales bacterium]|nr:type II secretion system protein [Clostridiales bacterium]